MEAAFFGEVLMYELTMALRRRIVAHLEPLGGLFEEPSERSYACPAHALLLVPVVVCHVVG